MSTKSIILADSQQEVIMFGDYVGVCWNLKEVEESITVEGSTYKAFKWKRTDQIPYIDFLNIREDAEGPYAKEDSPVEGGVSVDMAKDLVMELKLAVEYIEEGGK